MRTTIARAAVIAALAAAAVAAPAAAAGRASAGARQLPVSYNGLAGYAHVSATASPPGANDWSCKPTKAHPRPVLLVHGTFADMSDSWQALSPLLYDHGYCVFALNYGSHLGSGLVGVDATGDVRASARQLARFVARVLRATGARQVDIVGHSQGGMMPRYYLRFLGGAARVHTLVGLAPSNHGTTVNGLFVFGRVIPGLTSFFGLCVSCGQQAQGSPFMHTLNGGGDTVAGVRYTVIESRSDEVVTPYSSAFLSGPHVTNITLQVQCARDHGEHLSMPYDHIADADVLTALDPRHPVKAACTTVLPIKGG